MEQKNLKIVYERLSNFFDSEGEPRRLYIRTEKGKRHYSEEIKEKDVLLILGIEQNQRCPHCDKLSKYSNEVAYSYPDQERMWELVFDAKILHKEKRKQILKLQKLIENKLSQDKLFSEIR